LDTNERRKVTISVRKVRNIAPKTPTYEVDDGTSYGVIAIADEKPFCIAHGEECAHAQAVVAHLAKKASK
jgi:hypothetical protein